MTKQQAISLRLAQWLGLHGLYTYGDEVWMQLPTGTFRPGTRGEKRFNPFASTPEGRAQFAECVIKSYQADVMYLADSEKTEWQHQGSFIWNPILHDKTQDGITAATLEAIYYAIGGMREWVE